MNNTTIYVGISNIIIITFSALVWFYLIPVAFFGYMLEKFVPERSIERAYKLIIAQIIITCFGLPMIIAREGFFAWGFILGFIVHILGTLLTIILMIFESFPRREKSKD